VVTAIKEWTFQMSSTIAFGKAAQFVTGSRTNPQQGWVPFSNVQSSPGTLHSMVISE
jgi:hypothetical protein